MNLYHISPNIIHFNIFNLLGDDIGMAGHFKFFYNLRSGKYLIYKIGGFGSLTYFPKEQNAQLLFPTKKQDQFLAPRIQKRLETACYYDRNASCHKGKSLLKSMQIREANGEYMNNFKHYFIWEKDTVEPDNDTKKLYDQVIKILDKSTNPC